jgi:hypothetical protein
MALGGGGAAGVEFDDEADVLLKPGAFTVIVTVPVAL